MTWTHTYSNSR